MRRRIPRRLKRLTRCPPIINFDNPIYYFSVNVTRKEKTQMIYFMALALALGLGVPIAVLGAGMGQGRAAAAALEGMARQPEMAGRIQTAMILGLAFIESLVIFALLVGILMLGKLPDTAQITQIAQTTAQNGGK